MSSGSNLKFILFLINPFISAIYSLKNIRVEQSRKLLYFWFLVFGAAFCTLNEAVDSYRLVEVFYTESTLSLTEYLGLINEYFTFSSNIKDIYGLTVNFLVGRFTDNYHWTYFIYALVFGFFYIKSLDYLLRYYVNDDVVFYSLLFIFCFSNPIFNINGMRMWTAAWIAVYSTLKVFYDGKYQYLALLLLTPLIHNSFFIWLAIVAIALVSWKSQKLWVVLFVASSFVSAVSYLNILQDYSYLLPPFLQSQVWSYTESESAIAKMSEADVSSLPLYAKVFNALPDYYRLALSYLLLFNIQEINKDDQSRKAFNILLVFLALTNFLSAIPSVYRFQKVCIPFLAIVWAMNSEWLDKYNRFFILTPFVYSYALLYWARNVISCTEIWLYTMPAPVTLIKYLIFP